ncbi:MAG: oligosaccharide flippase family protein [Bacteroidia bacterium]|nr:oligosaccharide flippase family protein [Bacteroidia bacterium]
MNIRIPRHIEASTALQLFQVIRFGSLLLISILFTKSCLTTSDIGYYETIMLVSGAVSFFWITGLIQSFLSLYRNSTTFEKKDTESPSPVIFNAFLLVSFFSILSFLFVYIFKNLVTGGLTHGTEIPYYPLLMAYVLIGNPTFLIEYIYLVRGLRQQMLVYGFLSYLLQVVLVCLPVFTGFGIVECLYGLLVITLVRFAWLIILVLKYSSPVFSFSFIKEHLHIGYPLILSALLSGSQQYIAGFIVAARFNPATLAIFRYGAREFPLIMLITNAFSNAMLPEFGILQVHEILDKIKNKSKKLIYFLFPLAITTLLLSKQVFPLVFNRHFAESAGIFNIFLLLVVSRLVFPQTIVTGLKKTNIILFASLAELIITTSLAFLLVNGMGIYGVAWAFVIAYYFEKIILVSYLQFGRKLHITDYVPVKQFIVGAVLVFIAFGITLM